MWRSATHECSSPVLSRLLLLPTLCSFGTASDPLLLYISSYLASQPLGSPSLASNGSSSGTTSSNATAQPLSPATHMWPLQWDELAIEPPIGQGSFGTVYRACWQETPVAVKVLIDKGALLPRQSALFTALHF